MLVENAALLYDDVPNIAAVPISATLYIPFHALGVTPKPKLPEASLIKLLFPIVLVPVNLAT